MFVVTLTYQVELTQVEAHLAAHVEFLQRQYAEGHFMLSGPKVPRNGGLILATTDDRAQLEAILAQDPFRQQGIAHYDIIEFSPNRSSTELAFLLDS